MTARVLWYIVTPLYKPAPGGAGVYYHTLANALAGSGADVTVVTEAFPGQPRSSHERIGTGSITVDRLFPLRAGRATIEAWTFAVYFWQNVKMALMPSRLRRQRKKSGADKVILVIHSSFFYKPSVLPFLLSRLRKQAGPAGMLVIDVRDPLFNGSLHNMFARFDVAIGCSQEVADRLRASLSNRVDVLHIPVPFERPPIPSPEDVAAVLNEHDLSGVRYVLNPNGVQEQKNYEKILKLVYKLREDPAMQDVVLVTAGRARDWAKRDDDAVRDGVLRYVGILPNQSLLALARNAVATVILSKIEGLPRSALEAFSMECPLLAPDIPEFRETIPGDVAMSDDLDVLAQQFVQVCAQRGPTKYPLAGHSMSELVRQYRALETLEQREEVVVS